MPSSTSNSNSGHWGKSWLLALLLAAAFLGGLEYFWRSTGHLPAVVDDQRLWALERSKVGTSSKEIILLGSSRMQTDISISTLKRLAPDYQIINLSADGTCGNATLQDLANNSDFKGIAIVETTSECLMFGNDAGLNQQFYVEYYHKYYNLNTAINRHIATFIQQHLTVIDPYLNLIKVVGDLLLKNNRRSPNYLTTNRDRSRAADYSKLDIKRHKYLRLQKLRANYDRLLPRISSKLLEQQVANLDYASTKIKQRGGKVFFIRFPVSNEHWIIDEIYFPRKQYWDVLVGATAAQIIHFKDISEINKLECPDTSHLNYLDTPLFTELLYQQISE